MVSSLVEHEAIETTVPKAKEARRLADKMVTLGKDGSLLARRKAGDFLRSKDGVRKVFDDLAPRFDTRPGGYTRIIPLGHRQGDNAPMCRLEFVGPLLQQLPTSSLPTQEQETS